MNASNGNAKQSGFLMRPTKQNFINQLRVVAFDSERLGPKITDQDLQWFSFEACGRHVLATLDPEAVVPPDIVAKSKNPPPPEDNKQRRATRVLNGQEAYAFLLMVATGLMDKEQGNGAAKGTMELLFQAHKSGREISKDMNQLMRNVLFDANLIANNVLKSQDGPQLIASSEEPATVAKRLLPSTGGKLLIIGDEDHITETSFDILARKYPAIHLTNTDTSKLQNNLHACKHVLQEKKIKCDLAPIEPSQIHIADYSTIVFCSPMGADAEFEKDFIHTWQAQKTAKPWVVHLKGDPRARGKTNGEWSALTGDPQFIDRERIDSAKQEQYQLNKMLVQKAFDACRNCAFTRATGDGTRRHLVGSIALAPTQYQHLCGPIEKPREGVAG